MEFDYRKMHQLETYLLNEVRQAFEDKGYLSAFDFFCIIVWKANRARSKAKKPAS